jgi:hypothetical protein
VQTPISDGSLEPVFLLDGGSNERAGRKRATGPLSFHMARCLSQICCKDPSDARGQRDGQWFRHRQLVRPSEASPMPIVGVACSSHMVHPGRMPLMPKGGQPPFTAANTTTG